MGWTAGNILGATIGTARKSSGKRTAEGRRIRWIERTTLTGVLLGRWTWRGMCGSGLRTRMGRITTGMLPSEIRRVRPRAPGVWFAAARGTSTMRRSSARRPGNGTIRTSGSAAWVFVAPRLLNYPLPFRPFTLLGVQGVKRLKGLPLGGLAIHTFFPGPYRLVHPETLTAIGEGSPPRPGRKCDPFSVCVFLYVFVLVFRLISVASAFSLVIEFKRPK